MKKKKRQYKEAIKDLNKALKLNPNYANAYNNRGFTKYNLKRYDEACNDYTKVIELDPKFAEAYGSRGFDKLILGLQATNKDEQKQYLEAACDDLNQVLELDPNLQLAIQGKQVVEQLLVQVLNQTP